jgi:hypothetical protein
MTALAQVKPLSLLPAANKASGDLRQGLAALPRGTICEILGDSSTGRTSVAQSMLTAATAGGEVVAVVDYSDAFDPACAQNAGVDLENLLWVQCGHRLEHTLRATDMILHSGGFGLIVLDLCDVPYPALNRIPISYWHRFRRAVEPTPSILLILARQSIARSCAARQFALRQQTIRWRGTPPFQTMQSLAMEAVSRKPMGTSPVAMEAFAET